MSKKKKKKNIRNKAVVKKKNKQKTSSPKSYFLDPSTTLSSNYDKAITITAPPIIEEPIISSEKVKSFSLSSLFDFKWIWIITVLFAFEVFFRFFTGSLLWSLDYIFIFCFSIIYGSIIYILLSFIKNKKWYLTIATLILIAFGLLFYINDLLHSQFKVFYDTQTVLAGAKDVFSQFKSEIRNQVFSMASLKKALCYLFPIVLYFISFAKNIFKPHSKRQILTSLFVGLVSAMTVLSMLISYGSYQHSYKDEYNFSSAIEDFGLISAIRLDFIRQNEEVTFIEETNYVEEEIQERVVEENKEELKEEIVYKDNILDLDFESLKKIANYNELQLDNYVSSLKPTKTNSYTGLFEGKNLILITAEAFSKEIINEELTPTLYRLANKGILFNDYYQPTSAGTTGGEYEILFGALPTNGGRSLKNTETYHNVMTIGSQLNRLGYEGWVFHNNDYGFYDRHLTHNNLGYSNGYMGIGNGLEELIDYTWPESDLQMFETTFPMYADNDKFNVYYMTVSGHSSYDITSNKMAEKNWHRVEYLNYSDRVKGYIAANLELEDGLTYLVDALERKGLAEDTVIVLSSDHFPYGLDDSESYNESIYLSELYGYSVSNDLERDHNALIIWSKSLENEEVIKVDTPVSSLDILPTLCNLFNTKWDSRLFVGRDVFSETTPLVFNLNYDWKTDKGFYLSNTGTFYPTNNEEVDESYIENIRNIVRNKIIYCQLYNSIDYFSHIFHVE